MTEALGASICVRRLLGPLALALAHADHDASTSTGTLCFAPISCPSTASGHCESQAAASGNEGPATSISSTYSAASPSCDYDYSRTTRMFITGDFHRVTFLRLQAFVLLLQPEPLIQHRATGTASADSEAWHASAPPADAVPA